MQTKEVMVGAPLVVWLYDRAFLAGSFAAALRSRRALYAGLAATWLLLLLIVDPNALSGGAAWAGFGLPEISVAEYARGTADSRPTEALPPRRVARGASLTTRREGAAARPTNARAHRPPVANG
jgi:hypothetical protein